MQFRTVKNGFVLLLAAALAGCGGKGTPVSTSPGTVTQVVLSPNSLSLVAGQVVPISASALNSSGNPPSPLPTITFNSSNTSIATVNPGVSVNNPPSICAGVWDSFFIVCNGTDKLGNPVAGTTTITASAQGVTSVPMQVTVHPAVTSIVVDQAPVPGCFSIKTTHQFGAHACSSATPHDVGPPCGPNGKEITSLIGPFGWASTNPSVGTVDSNGLATAGNPGVTGIVATIGTVNSPAANFRSCMPLQIILHINGDAPGQPTESATMNVTDTRLIQADMVDELGVTTNSAPVTVTSVNTEIAALSSSNLTAESPGGGSLVAACVPPTCGVGANLPVPVYSNLFSITVNGGSPATFVYFTTSFLPPSGTTPTLIPIDTSKTPIVAGTAINLPGAANSLIFTRDGSKGYMGTTAGIAALDTTTNTVSLVDPFVGKTLAVSPDGNIVIFSNAANDPGTGTPIEPIGASQRLVILNASAKTVESFVLPGAVAAAFTPDSSKAYIAASNGNVYVFSTFRTLLPNLTVGGANTDVAVMPGGAYAYFANSAGLQVMAACNNTQQLIVPTVTSTPQLVGATQNANLIVAVNATGVDIETATVTPVIPANPVFPIFLTPANCAPPVAYSNQFLDFAQGPFTARQLLVPTNGTGGNGGSHIVVLPVGINKLLVAVPGSGAEAIPLAGAAATEALSGGLTLDGNIAWVGVGGTNTVDEILLTNSPSTADTLQISTSFKKSDGTTPAPPNVVAVKPH
jgi:hypothetical protein